LPLEYLPAILLPSLPSENSFSDQRDNPHPDYNRMPPLVPSMPFLLHLFSGGIIMTSLVFYLRPEIVFVAMDTLITTVDKNEPHHFFSKMFLFPHLGSVMCGTGNMELAVEWFKQIHQNFCSDLCDLNDVCDLNKETPDRLRKLSQCLSQSSTCTDTTS